MSGSRARRPNRWLESRWMVTSWLFGAASFYLACVSPAEGGIEAFTVIGAIALGGGHLTNGLRRVRGEPTSGRDTPVPEEA